MSDPRIDALERRAGRELYPFQREGVIWLRERERALLSDDMGIGKSAQALFSHSKGRPMLVVCPASVRGVWAMEAAIWRPDLKVSILEGRLGFRWPENDELVVVSYESLPPTEAEWLSAMQIVRGVFALFCLGDPSLVTLTFTRSREDLFGRLSNRTTVVADEAQALKSPKSVRNGRFKDVQRQAVEVGGRAWLLTGTPLVNHPPDLWHVLESVGLARESFGSWQGFVSDFKGFRVVVPTLRGRHVSFWKWGRPDPSAGVPEKLSRVMLRRRRKDVLPELPDKRYRVLQTEKLSRATSAFVDSVERRVTAAGLWDHPEALPTFEGFSRARELLAASKVSTMLGLVLEHEEAEEPLVVFSAHLSPVESLRDREGWGVITGGTSPKDRTRTVERFQAGELRGIAGTVGAMGTGLTLTRASSVLFVDRAWTPAENDQAEDRLARIGQKNAVLVTILVAPHALDRRVAKILEDKRRIIDACALGTV
jgi:SWI/SNF-related matrix-associated actin-dependent regulator 1 of chromatin subfamily A